MVDGAAQLRIRVLGPLEVDGVDRRDLGSRKARTMLAALAAARGRSVPVDSLVELLWPEGLPASPADQLSVLASRLRRALGRDRIVRTAAGYAVRADWTDLAELDDRVEEAVSRLAGGATVAALAAATAALDLARGEPAEGLDAPLFDAERRTVARQLARARAVLAEAALAAGDWDRAGSAASELLDRDPYDESALRLLMRAHAAAGRPASALAAYAEARRRLAEDLGVDPAPQTEELHAAILRDETLVVSSGAATARPASRRPLVGRERELAALIAALDRASTGVPVSVLVEGEAGMGKTALVEAFAAEATSRGASVLIGRCDELGRDLPLQPVLDALQAPTVAAPPELSLVTTVPDVGAGRQLLFGSLLDLVARLAADRVLVLVVEDLHHAGGATVEWLQMAIRRPGRLLVLGTRRPEGPGDLPVPERVVLGPLDLDAVRRLVGDERAADLLERSGGNPLLLRALADSGDELPRSLSESVAARARSLGEDTATVLVAAAVLGDRVDLDLLAAVLRRPVGDLLDVLEGCLHAHLLSDDGTGLRFTHDLVRRALEASATPARRAFLHREASASLAGRPAPDPLAVARHAREGGDAGTAARWLVRAAATAVERFDAVEADRHLSEAVALADSADARMARARVRMAVWDMESAAVDASRALGLGGGVRALELAAWIAYYRRDHDDARRMADEGVARATDASLEASCLCVAARVRHARGDLPGAEERLERALAMAPPELRSVSQTWLAAVRLHQGHVRDAAELAARALTVPDVAAVHPFAPLHARFARACALGGLGRPIEALAELDRLDDVVAAAGAQGRRFESVSANTRGWVLRNLGRLDEADRCNEASAALAPGGGNDEPRYVGHLDLVESRLATGDLAGAEHLLDLTADIEAWGGTMAWRQRWRHRLGRARLLLALGEASEARLLAASVATDAESRGARRYAVLGRLHEARAASVSGAEVDLEAVGRYLGQLDEVAGLEAWWVTAEVAAAFDAGHWWSDAARRASQLAAGAGPYADDLELHVEERFRRLRR